ncbi:MAG TPA: RNase J family beta-CASP ribonuclease [Candidatus Nanoarchaeia archaeon]|nr:RNase J family beta-CASP ribonuclease [Candidatus Nanoarchaeia archaeon]
MPIEICAIGGYSEVGKNSTALKVDDEVIILDMGLHMENYIRYTEDEEISALSYEELLQVNAVPNYHLVKDWKDKVIGIVPSHGHLDHVGAAPFAASMFPQAPIICTPYTAEVLKGIIRDERMRLPNKIISVNMNSRYRLSKNITLEMVNVTHSIPHSALVVVHTPYGKVIYANDYKFDRHPTLGQRPNYERLEQLGKEKPLLLIIEALYPHIHGKTPSESVAKQMLEDVMLGVQAQGKAMIVTTFSSHLARLKSIIELGKKLNRRIVFLGRSLSKYVSAGERIQLINFEKDVQLVKQRDKMERILKDIDKRGKEKYLLVVTGHQGEPKAILSRMVGGQLPFRFGTGDVVIFSCGVIPVELNKENRQRLEQQLQAVGVRIFRDIHVSGHAYREDHRDMLNLLKPQHIIPSHAGQEHAHNMAGLAAELGYELNKNIHLMEDGKRFVVVG